MTMLGGRYRLISEVGTGGMASVWRAVDVRLDRTVAVKMLLPELSTSPRARERAELEARAAARLTHPNIAVVHDAGQLRRGLRRRLPYLVMEFVDGETLGQRLGASGSMPWQRAARIAVQVADALAEAHLHRVVHRDIKPGNIILTPSRVKVVDFGLAAFIGVLPAGPAGVLLGTPEYMAAEQLRGEPVTAAADVYALGVVLAQMLTGTLPWTATDRRELLQQRRRTPRIRMAPTAGVPAAIVALCDQCLSDDPDHRPSSRHVAGVLREVLAEYSPAPDPGAVDITVPGIPRPRPAPTRSAPWAPPGRQRPAGRRRWMSAAALALVAAAVGWTHPLGTRDVATASGPPEPPAGNCAVQYTSHRDSGAFTARLSIAGHVPAPWTLRFTMPRGQRVDAVTLLPWSQTDAHVQLAGAVSLKPTQTVDVTMTGDIERPDAPPPTGFEINGIVCDRAVAVIAAPPATAA
jgi:serine/threonine-protein kinase